MWNLMEMMQMKLQNRNRLSTDFENKLIVAWWKGGKDGEKG